MPHSHIFILTPDEPGHQAEPFSLDARSFDGYNDLKITALLREVTSYLQQAVSFNVNDMLQIAFRNTRVEMTPHERNQFYDKYIRGMRLVVDQQGNASIELNR